MEAGHIPKAMLLRVSQLEGLEKRKGTKKLQMEVVCLSFSFLVNDKNLVTGLLKVGCKLRSMVSD